MKTAPIYQVDAFTKELFGGNPAAVCLLDSWPEDEVMQNIARENNLPETAFLVKNATNFEIRWFTPVIEVDLCGHATLAAAHVLYYIRNFEGDLYFDSKSGRLVISKTDREITLDFPADTLEEGFASNDLLDALGLINGELFKGKTDIMIVTDNEATVRGLKPDFSRLQKVDARGIIVTAAGKNVDFVSRFFAPASGIDEDPVTGSAHCTMTPYWSNKLNKTLLTASQLSARGGELKCELAGDRVKLTGSAVIYLTGLISF